MPMVALVPYIRKPGVKGSHASVYENHRNGEPHPQGHEPVYGSGSAASIAMNILGWLFPGDGVPEKLPSTPVTGVDKKAKDVSDPNGVGGNPCP